MNRIGTSIVAIVVFMLVVGALGLFYIYSGSYNVAATNDLTSLSHWVFSTTTMNSIRAHSPKESPLPKNVSSHMLQEGAEHYSKMCVGCHGAPGMESGSWVTKGMTPSPPDLDHVAEELSDGELFWIVEHGIKHSGMPGMGPTHNKEKIQGVVAFVEQLPNMSPQEYKKMSGSADNAHEHGEESHEHSKESQNTKPATSN